MNYSWVPINKMHVQVKIAYFAYTPGAVHTLVGQAFHWKETFHIKLLGCAHIPLPTPLCISRLLVKGGDIPKSISILAYPISNVSIRDK